MSRKQSIDRDVSGSYIEQSLKITSEPPEAPVLIYPVAKNSSSDQIMRDRLMKLKENPGKVPSEQELKDRLTKLKCSENQQIVSQNRPGHIQSQTSDADQLMKQVTELVQLEKSVPKAEDEISARLASLRGEEKGAASELPAPNCDHQINMAFRTPQNTIDQSTVDDLLESMKCEVANEKKFMEELKSLERISPPRLSTSSEELMSNSDDSDVDVPKASCDVDPEVKKIIEMYTGQTTKKTKKKKKKKKPLPTDEDSDATSDSEKYSSSD